MEFTTIRLAHKKSEVEIESVIKYDIYSDIPTIYKNNNLFKIHKGSKFYDAIGLVDPWNIAISDRFKNLLEKNEIKGWSCYPIKIEKTDLKYFIFEIIGRAGLICKYDEDGDVEYGTIEVELGTWDGSDIFNLGKGGIRIINSKVKGIIEEAKITNIEFEDLSKY